MAKIGFIGLDLDKTLEVIHGTTATNGQLKINYATKVLTGDTEPGFQIDLAHKDLSLVMTAANAGRVPMPIGAAARESLSMARARGWGGQGLLRAARRPVRDRGPRKGALRLTRA